MAASATGGCSFAPAGPGGAGNSGGPLGTGNSSGTGLVGGGAAQNGHSGNSGMNCAQVDQPVNKLPPDILIIQDKSSSMNDDATGMTCNTAGCTKWQQTTAAVTQVVTATDATVNWGLKFFSSPNGGACGVSTGVDVAVAPNNANAVNTMIGRQNPSGNTPTRRAIVEGAAYLATLTDMNPKYLLLATDGLPNCPDGCSGNACGMTPNAAESAGATQAVADAAAMGFNTFVIGIATSSDASSDATLTSMANAGGVPRAGSPPYYPVANQADLVNALNQIVVVAGTCVFPVPDPPNDMTSRSNIGVKVNGSEIPRDQTHTNGWDYTNPAMTAVQVYGPNCDGIMNGTITMVQVVFKCIIG